MTTTDPAPELNERQRTMLDLIERAISSNGYPPTTRELATQLDGISTLTVRRDLDALVAARKIERDPRVTRGIRLVVDY